MDILQVFCRTLSELWQLLLRSTVQNVRVDIILRCSSRTFHFSVGHNLETRITKDPISGMIASLSSSYFADIKQSVGHTKSLGKK